MNDRDWRETAAPTARASRDLPPANPQSQHTAANLLRANASNVLIPFVLSPAARAAAHLLAEALLLLLRALVSESADLPAETVASLRRTLEDLVTRLRHITQTEQPAGQTQRAAPIAIPSRAPTRHRPARVGRIAPRPRPPAIRHPTHARPRRPIRQRTAPQPSTSPHAHVVTITH